ncbi:hypothetical protein niasHT_006273 [Heterodera trifolii]|uniref:Uncharacterized protein n=1 Tax=Heterodera trifolii TaxID=157864 RepID=A0ABD2M6I9_9BILA
MPSFLSILPFLVVSAQFGRGNFLLDHLKSAKLTELFMAKNLSLEFDFRQSNFTQFDLFNLKDGDQNLLFRIESSTITTPNEIILEFRLIDGRHKLITLQTPFLTSNGQFHKITFVFDGKLLAVAQNCHRLLWVEDDDYSQIWFLPFGRSNVLLGVKSSPQNSHGGGHMQMRSFVSSSAKPLEQLCAHLETRVTDGNQMKIGHKNTSILALTQRNKTNTNGATEERILRIEQRLNRWDAALARVEHRVKRVELHQRGCKINGKWHAVGQHVQQLADCRECHCGMDGEAQCGPIGCAPLSCAHPIKREGKCCPDCGKKCFYNGQTYESGASFWPKSCVFCQCSDGRMNCEFRNAALCPPLDCAEQETLPNHCCPVCVNVDHCADSKRKICDPNAKCLSGRHAPICQCKMGFFGNGSKCYDVDECLWDEMAREQLGGCGVGSICINLPGSFKCDCLPGYQRVDERNCVDLIRI